MAVTQNTLIGRTSGSIGGVTFSTWKGLNVAKSKATSVADPKTTAQLAQRARMKNAVAIFKTLGSIANRGFVEGANGMSGYNVFISQNIKNGSIGPDPAVRLLNPSAFIISSGTLENTPITSAIADASAGTVTVSWNRTLSGNKADNDAVDFVVFDNAGQIVAKAEHPNTRVFETATVTVLRPLVVGETLRVFMSFYQNTSRKSSDSQS